MNSKKRKLSCSASLVALWILAFTLACIISVPDIAGGSTGDAADRSFMARIFGASRSAFSTHFYSEADRYFHHGVGGHHERMLTNSLFSAWTDDIRPRQHVELQGERLREVMPMLRFATQFDPSNIEAYQTAAYWLSTTGRNDLAFEVLREAQRMNPNDFRVRLSMGRLFLRQESIADATRAFDAGIQLWPLPLNPDLEEARIDLAQMLNYRAALYEVDRNPAKALELYRDSSAIVPENAAVSRRVAALEKGEDTRSWALHGLETIFRHGRRSHIMGGGEDAESHEGHDDESEEESNEHDHGPNCRHGH